MTISLSAERIAANVGPAARSVLIEVVAETGSTNADLLARVDQLESPVLRIAESQTAGRGRAGRSWLSENGASLTFSLAWKFQRPMHALMGLPLAVGVAVADALSGFGADVRLKWPNDLLQDGNKVAGILIETAADKQAGGAAIWAIIGIGINLAVSAQMAHQIGRSAAGLPALAHHDRNELMGTLLEVLAQALQRFEEQGFSAFMASWNKRHAYAGQAVKIIEGERVLHEGIALGVDAMGRLMLDAGGHQIPVMAGDVSLRLQEN